jgi:hypothetical protein
MKESEALEIIRLLGAGFHREAIEPETIQLWVEVISPMDAALATDVAMGWIKNQDRFPSISQFRHAYHVERRRVGQPELSAAHEVDEVLDLDKNTLPTWVTRWLRRFKVVNALPGPRERAAFEDWRVFPEQIAGEMVYRGDPRFTTAEAEALGVMPEDAWLDSR